MRLPVGLTMTSVSSCSASMHSSEYHDETHSFSSLFNHLFKETYIDENPDICLRSLPVKAKDAICNLVVMSVLLSVCNRNAWKKSL